MVSIMDLLEKLKVSLNYQRRLKKVQERASLNPENLFIPEDLFAHAIALKKIIFRLEPLRDDGEQNNLLDRLYDQMLIYREKTSIAQEAAALQTVSPQSPRPS